MQKQLTTWALCDGKLIRRKIPLTNNDLWRIYHPSQIWDKKFVTGFRPVAKVVTDLFWIALTSILWRIYFRRKLSISLKSVNYFKNTFYSTFLFFILFKNKHQSFRKSLSWLSYAFLHDDLKKIKWDYFQKMD